MTNNIKKAPVKFWEDLLYFQHFMQIFVFCSKLVIITTLSLKNIHRNEQLINGRTIPPLSKYPKTDHIQNITKNDKRVEYSAIYSTLSDMFLSSTNRILPILFAEFNTLNSKRNEYLSALYGKKITKKRQQQTKGGIFHPLGR